MLPYFFLLFIPITLPLIIYQKGKYGLKYNYRYIVNKRNRATLFLFFVGLFILLALRDITVGNDLREYRSIFLLCCKSSFENLKNFRWEIGYTFYNKLLSVISEEFRFLLIVTAAITLAPIYKLYSKQNKYSVLLVVIFINMPCFLLIFSGLRQAIAVSIGVLVYMAIENKKYIYGFVLILIGMAFHISAGVLVLLYPALFLKIKAKHLLYVVPLFIIIYYYRVPIFSLMINYLPSHYVQFYGEVQQTGAFGMMLLFVIFSVFSFTILDESIMTKKDYFLRNILLISTVFQFFVPVHGLIQRASYYFLILVPISIVSIVQAPKKILKGVSDAAIIVMVCFFFVYFFYNATYSTDNLLNVFPYKFFWSELIW